MTWFVRITDRSVETRRSELKRTLAVHCETVVGLTDVPVGLKGPHYSVRTRMVPDDAVCRIEGSYKSVKRFSETVQSSPLGLEGPCDVKG